MTFYRRQALFFTFWLLTLGLMVFQVEKHLFHGQTSNRAKEPLTLLLGSAKEAIGDALFLKANSYFHGGVDLDLIQDEAMSEHDEKDGDEKAYETYKKDYKDWVYQVNNRIKVLDHRHLAQREAGEIMPLLKAAVALDPYNVPAILTTAYWLEDYFKKTDDAIETLKQGLKNNPDSWEIAYHLGLDYYKHKKNYAGSEACFETALAKMNSENSDSIDHRTAYYFLGESYINQGSNGAALEAYRKALSYFRPSENPTIKSTLKEKIKILSGQP